MNRLAVPLKLGFVLVILAYIFLLIWFGNVLRLSVASQKWPQVRARVITYEVVARQRPAGGRYGRQPFIRHEINISYTYTVAGSTYTSGQYGIARTLNATSTLQLDQLRARYAPGSDTIAYYDPQSPGHAILVTGWSGVSYAVWIAGSSLTFLTLAALLGGHGKVRARKRSLKRRKVEIRKG